MKQPTNASRVQTLLQPARQSSQTSQDQPSDQTPEGRPPSQIFISALPTLNISIPVTMHHHFSSWHFPQNLTQSSIQGLNRSNACTLIALTVAKLGNCEEELPKKPVGRLSVNCRPSVDRQVTDSLPTAYQQLTDRLRKKKNCGKHEQLT